jgi:hypothetical protein
MSTEIFYICWCGNRESNHNFKHPFSPSVKVTRENNSFILSALDYPVKEGEKCTVPECTAQKSVHRKRDTPRLSEILNPTTIIDHDFQPNKYTYREIKFSIPPDTKCLYTYGHDELHLCNITLESHCNTHGHTISHHFTTKIDIQDVEKDDKISIFSRENEDMKIIYKKIMK